MIEVCVGSFHPELLGQVTTQGQDADLGHLQDVPIPEQARTSFC